MNEFDLIDSYFNWQPLPDDVRLGVGDDAAIVNVKPTEEIIISVDTFISGVHCPVDTPAQAIGYKALAVNLSDLAAMGARPRWFTLALTLPDINQPWLSAFSQGLRDLAQQYGIFLIGGDTTRGALSITIQVIGTAPKQQALLRQGAQVGDAICISGTLGDAAAGLAVLQQRLALPPPAADYVIQRLNYPSPRIALGQWLRGRATSCMDISDGLLGDLGHLLKRSQVGAQLKTRNLTFSAALAALPYEQAVSYVLNGGDDYELLFTLPFIQLVALKQEPLLYPLIQVIGTITNDSGALVLDEMISASQPSYNHFPSNTTHM